MKGIMETFFHGLTLGFTIVGSFALALYTFNSVAPLFVPTVNPPQPAPNPEIPPVPAPMPDHPLKQFSVLPLIPETKQMIVLEWLFLTITPCDAAEPWQLGFQDATTLMMQGIIDLHHDIFFFLILILVFVLRILTIKVPMDNHSCYKISEDDIELDQSRLLEMDNRVVVLAKTHLFIINISSLKCDVVLGRLNQISISIQREGVDYGQCSEICGTNHAFKRAPGNIGRLLSQSGLAILERAGARVRPEKFVV
ncbi:Cytochrome c oxidase subunit II-like C-terminal - like 1 [Theobroma cacao]|nr:Cytochrome c oxidase subunit II-like C-terminal - like 1 [Theobroma cacao]